MTAIHYHVHMTLQYDYIFWTTGSNVKVTNNFSGIDIPIDTVLVFII